MQLVNLKTNQGKMENWVGLPLRVYILVFFHLIHEWKLYGKIDIFFTFFPLQRTFFLKKKITVRTLLYSFDFLLQIFD